MFEQFIEFFMYRQKAREKSALLARAAKAAKQEDQENDRGVNEEVQGMQLEEIAADDNDNGSGGLGAQQIAAIAAAVIEPEAVQPQGHAHGKQ
jgi:hypothetical protein